MQCFKDIRLQFRVFSKNKLLLISTLLLLGIIITTVDAQENNGSKQLFDFKYKNFDKYRIEAENTQDVYINNALIGEDIFIENKILMDIKKREKKAFLIDYNIETIENNQLIRKESSLFTQYTNGYMLISKDYEIPYVRNIPQFPLLALSKGDSWNSLGQDNILLPDATDFQLINANIDYVFLGYEKLPLEAHKLIMDDEEEMIAEIDEKNYPIVSVKYSIDDRELYNKQLDEQQILSATFDIKFWWNDEDGRVEFYKEDYIIRVQYENDDVVVFDGSSIGRMKGIEPLDSQMNLLEQMLEPIIDEVKIEERNEGVTLILDDVLFKANSAIIEERQQRKLDTILKTFRLFPDRRILVEGYTALAGTEQQRKELSTERAKAVMDYLIENSKGNSNNYIYKGRGADNPVADNLSENGRAQNRRVEITILEN